MSVSTGRNDPSDDDLSAPTPVTYQYDLRLEISVTTGSGPVPVASIFRDLVQRLKSAADEGVPGVLAVWLAVHRGAALEAQFELRTEQLGNAVCFAPLEGRRRRGLRRRGHVALHHEEHLENVAVG